MGAVREMDFSAMEGGRMTFPIIIATGLLFLLLLGLLFSLLSDATCVNSLQCSRNLVQKSDTISSLFN